MRTLGGWWTRIRRFFRRRSFDEKVREEMQLHLELAALQAQRAGDDPDTARRRAALEFGHVEGLQERVREERLGHRLHTVAQDLTAAARSLGRVPVFTATAIVTVAFGIAISTTAFSVLNALVFRPLPYPEGHALAGLRCGKKTSAGDLLFSPANFVDLQRAQGSFTAVAAGLVNRATLIVPDGPPEQVLFRSVSGDFFSIFGATYVVGRGFAHEEDTPAASNVVVLSYTCWMSRYGGDPNIVGRTIRLDAKVLTVLGVLVPEFHSPLLWGEAEFWMPLAIRPAQHIRNLGWLEVYARLRPGVTLGAAQAEMQALASRLAQDHPAENEDLMIRVYSLEGERRSGQGLHWIVLGLALVALLIACANLANLQLVRALRRTREHAIHLALGAPQWRLFTRLLGESLLLSGVGGCLGVLLTLAANRMLGMRIMSGPANGVDLPIDVRVLVFAVLVSALVGVLFGLGPAWMARRTDVQSALRFSSTEATAGGRRHSLRDLLVVSEIALALVLLTSAGYFFRTLHLQTTEKLGWEYQRLLTSFVPLPYDRFPKYQQVDSFTQTLRQELRSLPGVRNVSIASAPTVVAPTPQGVRRVDSDSDPSGDHRAAIVDVTPEHFATLGIGLREGRQFDDHDDLRSMRVAMINATMARELFPNESALGRVIQTSDAEFGGLYVIVGVVNDTRPMAAKSSPKFQVYRSIMQTPAHWLTVSVLTEADPAALIPSLREAVQRIDPLMAVGTLRTGPQWMETLTLGSRTVQYAITSFAGFGLLLAAIGLYGVIAFAVAQRTREIGIRVALGSTPADAVRLVLQRGLFLGTLGVALGVLGSLAATRVCAATLGTAQTFEWALCLLTALVVLMVALVSTWLPARRAARIDPVRTLRAE